MKRYAWRKNFTAISSGEQTTIKGKLTVKTEETDWIHTREPILIPLSIYSMFHEGLAGDLKMNALLSVIKSEVKGKITVLLTEKAHLNVESLRFSNNVHKALTACQTQARTLVERFKPYFEGCNIVFWQDYIDPHPHYSMFKEKISRLYQTDAEFRSCLKSDAESTYTPCRNLEFPDKELFIHKACEDILEQCCGLLAMADNGHRYLFYPGKQFDSTQYAFRTLAEPEWPLSWIQVFVSIEKKIVIANNALYP